MTRLLDHPPPPCPASTTGNAALLLASNADFQVNLFSNGSKVYLLRIFVDDLAHLNVMELRKSCRIKEDL